MPSFSQNAPLDGIWSPRKQELVGHSDAKRPSDAQLLARHVVNTQGLEGLTARPEDAIAREIFDARGDFTQLQHPPK